MAWLSPGVPLSCSSENRRFATGSQQVRRIFFTATSRRTTGLQARSNYCQQDLDGFCTKEGIIRLPQNRLLGTNHHTRNQLDLESTSLFTELRRLKPSPRGFLSSNGQGLSVQTMAIHGHPWVIPLFSDLVLGRSSRLVSVLRAPS